MRPEQFKTVASSAGKTKKNLDMSRTFIIQQRVIHGAASPLQGESKWGGGGGGGGGGGVCVQIQVLLHHTCPHLSVF